MLARCSRALRTARVPAAAQRALFTRRPGAEFSNSRAAAAVALPLGLALGGFALWRRANDDEATASDDSDAVQLSLADEAVPREILLGKYELKKVIGKGGFGEVWLAVDRRTKRRVAIKMLSLKQLPKSMATAEVNAMRRCGRHPNVVELLEAIWIAPDEENPFGEAALVMEVAEGGGLFERLVDEGAYSERDAAAIMQQMALAIYHLHSRGIMHRDLKPENVVFDSADDLLVRVIDFGTAVVLEDEGEGGKVSSGGRIGTWQYWAPEQLNKQEYDFAVDMWSLGVLLYILLVGFHPFDPDGDGTEKEILASMRAGRVDLFDQPEWGGVSSQAKGLVASMLTSDPKKRLQAAALVTHPWVRGEDVPVKPLPATHERLSAFIRARHAFYGSLLMGLLTHHLSAASAEGLADGSQAGAAAEFDAFEVGWRLFDKDNKGHIDASDLLRVCLELGYKVSSRDLENMLHVMSPTRDEATSSRHSTISFERYCSAMQASFTRRYEKGAHVFRRGDPVDHFCARLNSRLDTLC